MSDTTRTRVKKAATGFEIGIRMPKRHQNTRFGQDTDLIHCDVLWRDCDLQNRQGLGGIDQGRKITFLHWTDKRCVMRTFTGNRQMRAFKMKPRNTRHRN